MDHKDYFIGKKNLTSGWKAIWDILVYQLPNDEKKNNDQYGDTVHRRYFETEDDFILGYISKFFDLHLEQLILKKKEELKKEVSRIDIYKKLDFFKGRVIEDDWEDFLFNLYYGYNGKKAVKFVYEKNLELLQNQNENFTIGAMIAQSNWLSLPIEGNILVTTQHPKDYINIKKRSLRPQGLLKYFKNKTEFYNSCADSYDFRIKEIGIKETLNTLSLKTIHNPILD